LGRHHGMVSGPFFVIGIKCVIPPWDMSCNLSKPFFRGRLLTNPRVHKHARHGGVSWRGRGRQPIRQAATAISASVFSPSDLSRHQLRRRHRHGFGTNFCYQNQMRDSTQGYVLQLVEAFLSKLAIYKPTWCFRGFFAIGITYPIPSLGNVLLARLKPFCFSLATYEPT
jgi:hypothetical protein